MSVRTVYGLDIEIERRDTTTRDPAEAHVRAVALAGPGFDQLFAGSERRILRELDACLRDLPTGVLATWQGSTFDLPFLADRAARAGLDTGLRLRLDPSLAATQQPLIGHEGAYRAEWYEHRHVDACRVCNGEVVSPGRLSGAWRSFLTLVGLGPSTRPDDRAAEGAATTVSCDIASDARLTRALIERRLPSLRWHLDRVPPTPETIHLALVPEQQVPSVDRALHDQHSGPTAASA